MSFEQSATCAWAVAARVLGWRPDDFWQSTPSELVSALASRAAASEAPSRAEIAALMERDDNE
ncbi:MAG: phage tail assembly chaperone [Pseudomonadota bacterium]